jgi:hypothetical protein
MITRYRSVRAGFMYEYDSNTSRATTVPECTPKWRYSSYVNGRYVAPERLAQWIEQGKWVPEFPAEMRVPEGL